MSKGQYLSSYQKGIVSRYYEHADARVVNALQELVSEIAVAESEASRTKLWKRAADHLAKTTIDPVKAAALVQTRDVKAFAEAVARLSAAPSALKPSKPASPAPPARRPGSDDL